MKHINIDDFDRKSRDEGVWALHCANALSIEIQEKYLADKEDGIEKEEPILVPVKYIKEGEYLIVAQIGVEGYKGVQKIHKRYANILEIKKGKEIVIILHKDKAEYIVEDYDYVEEKHKTKEQVKREIIASGYVTEEEWDRYSSREFLDELPVIKREVN